MSLNPKLIKILQCPDCNGSVNYKVTPEKLWCVKCKRVFVIIAGIPRLLPKNHK